jgi:organic radical activating enzyme
MNIKYSEIFYSFQGEAELAGTPTVWLRLFGCNLECNGFGQKDPSDSSTWVLPYKEHDLLDVKRVEDLPVWQYGCDSSYSWSKRYKHLAQSKTVEEVCDELERNLPFSQFTHPLTGQENMLAFTGGEPMLWQKQMKAIVNQFLARGNVPKIITVETNGTKPLNPELRDFINVYLAEMGIRWHWAISPKILYTAGEEGKVLPDVFMDYVQGTTSTSIIKFVCNGTEESWDEIAYYARQVKTMSTANEIKTPEIWIMPAGATKEEQEQVADICHEAMCRGYKVATRNHSYVFGNAIGT